MATIPNGKPVHCVELMTGKNLAGTLVLSEETMRAQIYSYTEFFYVKGEPIILQAETNEIVSLHSNITRGPGRTSRLIEPKRTTYRQDITSNLAVVGHDPWTTKDKVKRVSFSVKIAHSHFAPESEGEFRAFSKSTMAMEALCYLLSAHDLPMSETGMTRVGSNPVVRNYREAYA